jgi:hypothetical protein
MKQKTNQDRAGKIPQQSIKGKTKMKKSIWQSILSGKKSTTAEIKTEIEALGLQKSEAEKTLEDIEKSYERGLRLQLAGETVDLKQIRADLQAVRDRIGAIEGIIFDLEVEFENALNMEGQARIAGLQKQLAGIEKLRAEGEEKLIDKFAQAAALFQSVRGVSGDQLDFRAFFMSPQAPLVRAKIKEYAESQRNLKAEADQLRHEIGGL